MSEPHFLVRLQGRLPLHIVLQRLTGDLVVERCLRECVVSTSDDATRGGLDLP